MFGELNERQEDYLRDIRSSGQHLLALINDILDLSKVEAGRMELELGPFRSPTRSSRRSRWCASARRATASRLRRDIAGDVGIVWADELRLKQVLLNLLTNAVKFTPDGGSVDGCRAPWRATRSRSSVADTGIGIAEADQERIFDAFQQGGRAARTGGGHRPRPHADAPDRRAARRADLGDERAGRGQHLRVRDPAGGRRRRRPGGATDAEPAPRPAPDRRRHRGRPALRRAADAPPEGAGLRRRRWPRDGDEGLELVRGSSTRRPSSSTSTCRGWTAGTCSRASRRTPPPRACRWSIVSMSTSAARFALGAAEYLVKPVTASDLLAALARCVPDQRGRAAAPSSSIDDDPLALELVEAVSSRTAGRCSRARAARRAWRSSRREQPAVVLVDLLMPEVDGFAVIDGCGRPGDGRRSRSSC